MPEGLQQDRNIHIRNMVEYEDDRPGWIVFFFIYINMPHPQKNMAASAQKSYYGINEPATDFFPNREPRTARGKSRNMSARKMIMA